MITVPYVCTRRQYKIGKKLLAAPELSATNARKRLLRWRSVAGWILFFLFATIFLRLTPANVIPHSAYTSIWHAWGIYASIVGGLLISIAMRLFRWSGWVQFRQTLNGITLTISEAGVEQQRLGVRTLFHWNAFTGLAERKGVYALRVLAGEGWIVPQSLFAPADQLEIDRLFKAKLATPVPLMAVGFEVRPT